MKYHGYIGFVTFEEKTPGVDVEVPVEREYTGDVMRASKRWENTQQVNKDLNISNQISIIADPYARDNLFTIRYLTWMGSLWEITSVDIQYPRLILSIGGVYNGPKVGSAGRVRRPDGCWCNGEIPATSEL